MIKKIISKLSSLFRSNNIFYIGSNDNLLPPLSRSDEEYFIDLKDRGSEEAKNVLIEHNLRLVVFLAKKYENTKVDLEDLVSIGTIGLIKGINTFTKSKNIKLATYVSRCIDNEILMYLRKNKRINSEVSLEDSLSFDGEGNELHLEDVLGTTKDIVPDEIEHKNSKNIMINEILHLDPRDRDIMILRYGLLGSDELTQKEVAEKLGISQSYISRIEKKVIKRLKLLVQF